MADMGMMTEGKDMSDMNNHDHPSGPHSKQIEMGMPGTHETQTIHDSHVMPAIGSKKPPLSNIPGSTPVKHAPGHHGTGNQSVAEYSRQRLDEPGIGLENTGSQVLVYTDLKSLKPYPDQREPEREIELHLTGHMMRYMWSFDGKKYSEAKEPIRFRYGERLRLTFVNDTMMEHPLHLHGMWMHLENGAGAFLPRKHTVIVKPAERLSVAVTVDAPGRWAFHCHLIFPEQSPAGPSGASDARRCSVRR
jgi:FtsP/CotA-like multicopper oxidase with cupredoxin domain